MGDISSGIDELNDGTAVSSSHALDLNGLYARHFKDLQLYIFRKFGGGPPEPEDVAQGAFAKLAALKKPEDIQNAKAFLYVTARNIVLDHRRRQKTANAYAAERAAEAHKDNLYEITPERVVISRDEYRAMIDTLHSLPGKQRRFIVLHCFHGLSYAEIAAKVAMSPDAVRKHIKRGLARCVAADAMRNNKDQGGRS